MQTSPQPSPATEIAFPAELTNEAVRQWVREMAQLCRPDRILNDQPALFDSSQASEQLLAQQALQECARGGRQRSRGYFIHDTGCSYTGFLFSHRRNASQ